MRRSACVPVKAGGSTSLRALQGRLGDLAAIFIQVLEQAGIKVRVTSTRRSTDVQRKLYANYLRGCSKYPAAPPGRSSHGKGLAFDLHLDPPLYAEAGRAWESIGGTWGGRFNDPIHFEVR